MIRVLVVGQDGPSVAALRAAATRSPKLAVVGPVPVGDVARSLAVEASDVVFLRAPSPAVSDALAAIRRVDARVSLLVEGLPWSEDLVPAVLAAGGCGVVQQGLPRSAIREAVLRAWAGELVLEEGDLRSLVAGIAEARARRASSLAEPLTGREREVLQAIADGLSTGEVAMRLGISAATVQSHVKNVLTKFRVHSKVEAVRMGWREGILAVPA